MIIAIIGALQTIVRHPKYSFTTKRNDIALIEFEGSVEFNDLVRPACIRTDVHDPPESREMIITGWGSIEADSKYKVHQIAKNAELLIFTSCDTVCVTYSVSLM